MPPWQILDLLLRGLAIGAQLGLCIALFRSADNVAMRFATLLFVVSNLCFTIDGSRPLALLFGPAQPVLWLIQIGGAGYFWLFAVTLFEDHRLTARSLSPSGALTLIGLSGRFGPHALSGPTWMLHNVLGLVLALHALVVIVRSGQNDLVEARRRLRVPFLVLVAVFSILLSAVQIGEVFGVNPARYEFLNAVIQAVLGIAGVAVLLEARPALFGTASAGPGMAQDAEMPDDSALWLGRLRQVMEVDALWRQEGLTIAGLAKAVGLPEHRLRRLINDQLGHRNFASFINQHRIEAAKAVLADPGSATQTVASIAFDHGFGSLGPFNRAFREATGQTPTAFRRRALAAVSPIPGNSG